MRFFVAFWIGVVLGLIGLVSTFPKAGESTIYFMLFSPITFPIFGGIAYFAVSWLKLDPEEEKPVTMWNRVGQALGVMIGLFLGTILGMLFAMLLAAGG